MGCRPWGSQRVGHDLATEQRRGRGQSVSSFVEFANFYGKESDMTEQLHFHFSGSAVKNLFAMEETGSIPESGRSPGERNGKATHRSILACEIPWTEEP